MKNNNNKMLKLAAAISAVSVLLPVNVYAASASNAIEEIIVSAQKRTETITEVPIAITAVSAQLLENTGVDDITDLIPMVPGLTGETFGIATNGWGIRGISSNDFGGGSEPSVGVYMDDAYVGRGPHATAAFFDVQRVEVLKGPQGTLFGRNSSIGAISIISNKPEFTHSLRFNISAGNEGQRNYDAVGNLALSDSAALRVAYHGTRLEGIQKNTLTGNEEVLEADNARVMLAWNPSDDVEVMFSVNGSDAEGNTNQNINVDAQTGAGRNEFSDNFATNEEPSEKIKTEGANITVLWALDEQYEFTSNTDYRAYETESSQDGDGGDDGFAIAAGFGIPLPVPITVGSAFSDEQDSIAQEFRFNSSGENIDWFIAASYFEENIDESAGVALRSLEHPVFGPSFLLGGSSASSSGQTKAYGIYGDVKFYVNEAWNITAGARWSNDQKEWCTFVPVPNGMIPLTLLGNPTVDGELCESEEWFDVSPRVVLNYQPSEGLNAYLNVSKGFKGGGFNQGTIGGSGPNDPLGINSFDPEENRAVELGIKTVNDDNTLRINAAIYYNDYTDLQVLKATTASSLVQNAAEAETTGLEFEATYIPLEKLSVSFAYSYNDNEFTEGEFKGNHLASAPEHTASISGTYVVPVGAGEVEFFGIYNWQDEQFFESDNRFDEDAFGRVNARVTYFSPKGDWTLYISGQNLTDKEFATSRNNPGFGNLYRRGMPRLVSVGASIEF